VNDTELQRISDQIKFTWDVHIRLLHLLITLSSGTLALSPSLIQLTAGHSAYRTTAAWGISLIAAALVLALAARILSQFFMLQEVVGGAEALDQYYVAVRVVPFTSTHQILQGRTRAFAVFIARLSNLFAVVTFGSGLICLAAFVAFSL
jgi:hypothetical protein